MNHPAGSITIADVGARWGAAEAWFRLPGLARLIGFEPDVEECAQLNRQAGPHERYYPVALGNVNGPKTLWAWPLTRWTRTTSSGTSMRSGT